MHTRDKLGGKSVIDFYKKGAEVYDARRFSTTVGKYTDFAQKEIVLGMVDSWEGKRVLDLGCGTGRFTIEISKRGAIVTAIDPSTEMLAKLNQKIKNTSINGVAHFVNLVNGSAYNLPFENNEFEGCICINVLNHLPNWDKVLSEIHRILIPNGFFIMNFTNIFSLYLPIALWVNLTKRSVVGNVYSRWDILLGVRKKLRQAGFNPEQIMGITLPPLDTPKMMLLPLEKFNTFLRNSSLKRLASTIFVYSRVI